MRCACNVLESSKEVDKRHENSLLFCTVVSLVYGWELFAKWGGYEMYSQLFVHEPTATNY